MKHAALLVIAFTAACAGGGETGIPITGAVSRLQCADFRWRGVGLYDGRRGAAQPGRFDYLSNTCSSHGYKADREAYFEGYAEGRGRAGG